MYRRMQEEAVQPNGYTFVSLFMACGSAGLLKDGVCLHAEASHCVLAGDLFVSAALLDMYGKCGSLIQAEKVFDTLKRYNEVIWTTMLSAYVNDGRFKKVLQLYNNMQEQGIITDDHTILIVLKASSMLTEGEELTLKTGRKIHVDAQSKGLSSHLYVGNGLMMLYGKNGSITEAENVFIELSVRTVVSWTTMLTVYVEHKAAGKALRLFQKMQLEGVSPNAQTFVVVLQACCILAEERSTELQFIEQIVEALHADVKKLNYTSDVFVCNTFIGVYGRLGNIMDAINVFLRLSKHTSTSWNSLLSAFMDQGEVVKALQLYAFMRKTGVPVDQRTFVVVLQACGILAEIEVSKQGDSMVEKGALQIGYALHNDIKKEVLNQSIFICNSLISMYGKCGDLQEAQVIFNDLKQPNIVSWNSLLSAYVSAGRLTDAECIFFNIPQHNVVSWNTMIAAYVEIDKADVALELFRNNCFKKFVPTRVTFMIALQACCIVLEEEKGSLSNWGLSIRNILKAGQEIHFEAEVIGLGLDVVVGSSLINMYSSSGCVKECEGVFSMLSGHEMVYNAMLSVYAKFGLGEKVLQLLEEIGGINLYGTTLIGILHACIKVGLLTLCHIMHFISISTGCDLPVDILVHAYGASASLVDALAIFAALPTPERNSWSASVSVSAHHGELSTCLKFFDEMKLIGMGPDRISFISSLFVCTHMGLLHVCFKYYECMIRDHCVVPDVQHYGLILDSLGRAGDFQRVESALTKMPMEPDMKLWTCLLAACHRHSYLELAETILKCNLYYGPIEASTCVLISNLYASAAT
ncbi:hypothetical protein KP509_15G051000 [Ceratopteris richardii]|nr:hypothetical protein KP509_15G051000 [Ceratopteris richardii]